MRQLGKDYKQYARFMKAFSDETRIQIIDMLSSGELCACSILKQFSVTQPTLSYHMKILCESGLVEGRREGIWMWYSINKENLQIIKKFLKNILENYDEATKEEQDKQNF